MKKKLIPKANQGTQFSRFQWTDENKKKYAEFLGIDPSHFEGYQNSSILKDKATDSNEYESTKTYAENLNKRIYGGSYDDALSNLRKQNGHRIMSNGNIYTYDNGQYYRNGWTYDSEGVGKKSYTNNYIWNKDLW